MQDSTAKDLNLEGEEFRAVGNLGLIDYQVFLNHGDQELLEPAFEQLHERVRIVGHIRAIASIEELSTTARLHQICLD